MISFKGAHFSKDIILMAIRWYLAYPLSYRHVEELLKEGGVAADHATINRWVVKYGPLLEIQARKFRKPITKSWRMDETYIKVRGRWCYYYRAVDTNVDTIAFFLAEKRDLKAAYTFLDRAIALHGLPEKINIDKSSANLAALEAVNSKLMPWNQILIRQIKYLNNLIEQDHRAIKRMTRPMMGFKNINTASSTLTGIELCHMILKGQLMLDNYEPTWKQFYALAC